MVQTSFVNAGAVLHVPKLAALRRVCQQGEFSLACAGRLVLLVVPAAAVAVIHGEGEVHGAVSRF